MTESTLRLLLESLLRGETSIDAAVARLKDLPYEAAGVALVDHHRALRLGAAEIVFGEGKAAGDIATIVGRLVAKRQNVLVTRLAADKVDAVMGACPDGVYDPVGRTFTHLAHPPQPRRAGRVAVVCAGTSDLPVLHEAATTLAFLGHAVERVVDVGVAGLHRLLPRRRQLAEADAVVVIAGMEGALPSVVGGMVGVPVVAVPTSVGYGTAFGGLAALFGMLGSCASGVTVVNIDNGFGAAFAVHRLLGVR